jgi:hypothetical protein
MNGIVNAPLPQSTGTAYLRLLITSRTPREASSRSLNAALVWLFFELLVAISLTERSAANFEKAVGEHSLRVGVGLGSAIMRHLSQHTPYL